MNRAPTAILAAFLAGGDRARQVRLALLLHFLKSRRKRGFTRAAELVTRQGVLK